MNRRDFLTLSMAAVSSAALAKTPTNAETDGTPSGGKSIFKVKPHVALEGDGSVSIVWITHVKSTGHVSWSQDGWKTEQRTFSVSDGFREANTAIHRIVIRDVDFSKPLFYKVHSRPIKRLEAYKIAYAGAEETFEGKTNPLVGKDGAVSWAMFNDVHENLGIYSLFGKHLNDISSFCAFNGDLLNHIDDEATVTNRLLNPFADISQTRNLPVAFIRGNHETRGEFARSLKNYTGLFDGKYYGALSIGNVRFLFLDSGEDKSDAHPAYFGLVDFDRYLEEQNGFIRKEIASAQWKSAKARIVMRHIPFSGGGCVRLKRLEKMDAILGKAGVTLMMCAHMHYRGWRNPTPARAFPTIIGGGCTRSTHPNNGATLVKCSVLGDTLSVNMMNTAGETKISKKINLA